MFFLSLCCQSPFPRRESQSTSPPRMPSDTELVSALLWGSWDSNLALLLCLLLQCPQPSEPARLLSRAHSVAARLLHRHGVCLVGPVGYSAAGAAVGRFWVFFLSHTAPGFHLRFYLHLWMWVVHWSLLLRLPWRTWVCPCEGQGWRWYSCLGLILAAPGAQGSGWLGQQEI